MANANDRPIPGSTVAELFARTFGERPDRIERFDPPLRATGPSERALLWSAPDSAVCVASMEAGTGSDGAAERLIDAWGSFGTGHGGVASRSEVLAGAWESVSDGECWLARSSEALLALWAPTDWWERLLPPVPAPGTVVAVAIELPRTPISGVLPASAPGGHPIVLHHASGLQCGRLSFDPAPKVVWGARATELPAAYAQFHARVGDSMRPGTTRVTLAATGVVRGANEFEAGTAEWVTSDSRYGVRVTIDATATANALSGEELLDTAEHVAEAPDADRTQHLTREAVALLLSGRGPSPD
jgi:hypothetical protein